MSNTTFLGSEPIWANACVGDNGYINYFTYAEGYSKAANLILDQVLNNKGRDIDSFIYPICFNMRHSIELRLKGAIEELQEVAKIKKIVLPLFDLVGSHDIGNIWTYFKEKSELLDLRFKQLNDLLDRTILDIGEIDSTGQTFRYPFDTENKKHLTEQSIISCLVLKIKFKELEENLDNLNYLNEQLIEEYKKGTFTSKFSRSQIFNLVPDLPSVDKWSTDLNKDALRLKYSLTSNDLTKILNLVKSNYEISCLIGIKKNLITLSDDFIVELCDIWANKFYPRFRELYTQDFSSDFTESGGEKDFEEMKKYFDNRSRIYEHLSPKLTVEIVADLWALFYLSRDRMKYSEDYIMLYNYWKRDIEREGNLIKSFNHIFSKTNFLDEVIKSLFFLQQTQLVETIIKNNSLERYFKSIPAARDRSLFKKWELLDYKFY